SRHPPRVQLRKPVLHLYRAPLVQRGVPAPWNQASRASDRPRVPGSVRQIGSKDLALVRRDEYVVAGGLLGENGHLTLDQGYAAAGAPGAAGILEYPFLHYLGAEARGRAPQRFGEELVLVVRAGHQQPALPLLPHQILGKRVCEHRAGRRNMDHIGAAILLAQPIVDRSRIEENGSAIAQCVGSFQQRIRGKIGDDEAVAASELRRRLAGVVTFLEPELLQKEALIEESAGCVVVLDREACAGNA